MGRGYQDIIRGEDEREEENRGKRKVEEDASREKKKSKLKISSRSQLRSMRAEETSGRSWVYLLGREDTFLLLW